MYRHVLNVCVYIYIHILCIHTHVITTCIRSLQLEFVKLRAGIADAISARLRVELPAGDAEQPPPKEKAPPKPANAKHDNGKPLSSLTSSAAYSCDAPQGTAASKLGRNLLFVLLRCGLGLNKALVLVGLRVGLGLRAWVFQSFER